MSPCKAWGLLGHVRVPLQGDVLVVAGLGVPAPLCCGQHCPTAVPTTAFILSAQHAGQHHAGVPPCPLPQQIHGVFSIKRPRAPEDCSVLEHYKYVCEDSAFCLTPDTLILRGRFCWWLHFACSFFVLVAMKKFWTKAGWGDTSMLEHCEEDLQCL